MQDRDKLKNFIMHPDWVYMQEYIVKHFEKETDVSTIDTSKDSSVIHAEVIARQRIGEDITSLLASFKQLRDKTGKSNKPSYE